MVMDNAYSSWGLTAGGTGEMEIGQTGGHYYVNDVALAAAKYGADDTEPVALCVVPTTADNNTVYVDDNLYYQGGLHQYCYTDCTKLDPPTEYTMDNWGSVPAEDEGNLYLYLTTEDIYHTVTVNSTSYDYMWNGSEFELVE